MASPNKAVRAIVLDTGCVVRNEPGVSTLLAKSENLVTVPSVISEIRDPSTRSRFGTTLLPFLEIKTPDARSIKFVSDFAKRTGDISVLSRTDVEVLALAYELEVQSGGEWRIRNFPGQKGTNGSPPPKKNDVLHASDAISQPPPEDQSLLETPDSSLHKNSSSVTQDSANSIPNLTVSDEANSALNGIKTLHLTDSGKQSGVSAAPDEHRNTCSSEEHLIQESSSDSGSEGWITPKNIKRHQAKDKNASTVPIPEDSTIQVAVITTECTPADRPKSTFPTTTKSSQYSHLYSPLPRVLRKGQGKNFPNPKLRRSPKDLSYLKDTSKQFCPRCGKPTLTRVSCSTNQKGEFKIHLKKNMQWNHRGDRFSIPKPVPGGANGKVGQGRGGGKGGWGQELIFAEDQKEYQRAMTGRSRKKETDLMDEDYLPGILTGERGKVGGRPKVGAGRNVNSKKRF